ncbi:hypothetical protein MLD38_020019 [Melastoma candidum]|uniref:Uncharacterized protein n=1 Tax=Melastoma candidum TaxID=119954 RepID=A0ACB9QBB1_9MYRT|nr:hypothetical protein MLD38_020019 [Melastoma candidum]
MNHHARGYGSNAACASCKHQRKKCDERCPLSPYFPADKSREFQAVHRVFGVSNVTKMMMAVSEADRARQVESLVFEALVRQRDPVLGIYGEYHKSLDEVLYLRNLAQTHVLQIQQLQAEIKRIACNNNNNVVGICHVGNTPVTASPGLVGWNNHRGNNPVANLNLGRAGIAGSVTNDGNVGTTHAMHENESCIIDAVPFAFRMGQHLDIKNENQEQELASTAAAAQPQQSHPPMGEGGGGGLSSRTITPCSKSF